jgi:hypothetical protein
MSGQRYNVVNETCMDYTHLFTCYLPRGRVACEQLRMGCRRREVQRTMQEPVQSHIPREDETDQPGTSITLVPSHDLGVLLRDAHISMTLRTSLVPAAVAARRIRRQ